MSKRLVVAVLLAALLVAMVGGSAMAAPAPAATNGEILFVRLPGSGSLPSLYRTAADGSHRYEVRRLSQQLGDGSPGAVSPEGRRLLGTRVVVVDGRAVTRLTVSNVDGSAPRDIAEPRTSYRGAVWSPDGLRVTYFARGLYFVVPADGSEPARELGRVPSGDLLEIEWPPGAEEPTLRNRSGEDPIEIDAETGEYKRTTDAGFVVDDVAMAWSPDGSRVAYLGWASNREVGTSCGFAEVGLIDPDTLTMTPIRPRPAGAYDELCNAHGLRWAPDGRHLVFSASRVASYGNSGPHSLYRLDLADGAVTRITDRSETDDFVVDWLPVPDLLGRACPSGSTPSAGFPDTAGSSHARGIDCAVAWEIAAGRTDGTYGPGVPVTRAQMASFVARALEGVGVELPEITGSRFDDVDATSTHGQRIEQLAELGLVDGVTPGRYAPGRSVTRAQMAKFLVGAYEQAAEQSLPMWPDAFVDDDGVALESWVNAASSVGLTGGVESSRYAPGGVVDRGQMATFLSRLVDRLARDLDLPAR